MQIESAMGGSYRDRAKERRSKFGDDIPPGDNYDNYNDDYRYFYISIFYRFFRVTHSFVIHFDNIIYILIIQWTDRTTNKAWYRK